MRGCIAIKPNPNEIIPNHYNDSTILLFGDFIPGKRWSEKDIELLKNVYPTRGNIYRLFPDRTKISIITQANRMGLKRPSKRTCRCCGINLDKTNTYPSSTRRNDWVCRQCIVLNNRKYRARRPEHYREYYQRTTLHTNGRTYCRILKRPKPDVCEVCSNKKHLIYHHYGDIRPKSYVPGLWVCGVCHAFIERYEGNHLNKYLKLKETVLNENPYD